MSNTVVQPRLKIYYNDVICPELLKKFSYVNKLQIPRVEKIVLVRARWISDLSLNDAACGMGLHAGANSQSRRGHDCGFR